jgi:hypothetical protein
MTTVDFIPKINLEGQFVKISDMSHQQNNNRVNSLLNLIEYIEGTNSMFPKLGIGKFIHGISFNEEMDSMMDRLSSICTAQLGFAVSFDYKNDPNDETMIIVNSVIDGLPGSIEFSAETRQNFTSLINPKYVKERTY